jgi:cell division protein ZapA
MAQVSVTIGGRVYRMACDDGQEEHLMRLARELDQKLSQLREAFGEIGDTRLAVMAAIMVADDLSESRRRIRALEQEVEGLQETRLAATDRIEAADRAGAQTIEKAAERIERLAHALNGGLGGGGTALG